MCPPVVRLLNSHLDAEVRLTVDDTLAVALVMPRLLAVPMRLVPCALALAGGRWRRRRSACPGRLRGWGRCALSSALPHSVVYCQLLAHCVEGSVDLRIWHPIELVGDGPGDAPVATAWDPN